MKRISLFVLIISIAFISIYRILNIKVEKEITWDILGYYLPLPATFIQDDPLLTDISWLECLNEKKDLTGTLYMVSSNDQGEPMYFFFFGMSIFYLPFFLIGHMFALFSHFPPDGFSQPYQISLVIGAILYTIIGLVFLRKILNKFFADRISAIIILTTVFATNYIHHLTLINLEPVNVLFMLVCIILWYTIKWHEKQKLKYLLAVVSSIALATLVKPSEVIIFIIPLFWNVISIDSAKDKIQLIIKNKKQFIISFIVALLIVSPQILYWYIKTGLPFYDTYKNPGVGLDLTSPHILDVLFSFRKGWLLYTPVMVFYLWGMVYLYKRSKEIFVPSFLYFFISFYIISSWSEWWYGAGFSIRPFITLYPVLALGFGCLLEHIWTKRKVVRRLFILVLVVLSTLNLFQYWQYMEYIIHPHRTTKESYLSVFLKTSINSEQKELFSIERDFTGAMVFKDMEKYSSKIVLSENYEENELSDSSIEKDSANSFYVVDNLNEFAMTTRIKYSELTKKDHAWIRIKYKYRNQGNNTIPPMLVVTMHRSGKNYGYYTFESQCDSLKSEWGENEIYYLTPVPRSRNDQLLIYFWNRDKSNFGIDDFTIEVFEKREINDEP